jgi:hypothetical protein
MWYRRANGEEVRRIGQKDLAELGLANEGVSVDRRQVELLSTLARSSGTRSQRRRCIGRPTEGQFAECAGKI